jgi:hypothetical protein
MSKRTRGLLGIGALCAALASAVLNLGGCAVAGPRLAPPDPQAPPLRADMPLEEWEVALPQLWGFWPPVLHRFTTERDGHELMGVSFRCDAGQMLALFQNGTLRWTAPYPNANKMSMLVDWEQNNSPTALRDWALTYSGPTIAPEELPRLSARKHEEYEQWERTRSYNAAFLPLVPLVAVANARSSVNRSSELSRFEDTVRILDGKRIKLGTEISEVAKGLPEPAEVKAADECTRYTYARLFQPGLFPQPILHLIVCSGRVSEVMTVYSPPHVVYGNEETRRRWEAKHGPAQVGAP